MIDAGLVVAGSVDLVALKEFFVGASEATAGAVAAGLEVVGVALLLSGAATEGLEVLVLFGGLLPSARLLPNGPLTNPLLPVSEPTDTLGWIG